MAEWFFDPFARGTVLGSHETTDTFLNLTTGEGARFADAPAQLVIWDATLWDSWVEAFYGDGSPVEIVYQTLTNAGDQLPAITRAQQGTSALDMTDTTKTFRVQQIQSGLVVAESAVIASLVVPSGGISVEAGDVEIDDGDLILGDGAWDGQRIQLGAGQYLWIDSTGDLRIKTTGAAPTGDTDGTVVGTQT